MRQIAYQRAGSVDEAVQAAAQPEAAFLAGGTSLVDPMPLEATIHVRGQRGERDIPFGDFHLLPGDHPEREFALEPGELVTWVFVPATAAAARSRYVKVRDRISYAFALASCATALEVANGRIEVARIALGGVGTQAMALPGSGAHAGRSDAAGGNVPPGGGRGVARRPPA